MVGRVRNKARAVLFTFVRSQGALFFLFVKIMRGVLSIWPPLVGTCDGDGEGWPR